MSAADIRCAAARSARSFRRWDASMPFGLSLLFTPLRSLKRMRMATSSPGPTSTSQTRWTKCRWGTRTRTIRGAMAQSLRAI
eukprot:1402786-Rhodomonas_salina.3